MALEIERKFLVKGEFLKYSAGSIEIVQAYLSAEPGKTIRIRIFGNEAYLTVKSGTHANSFSRNEWEYSIPAEDAREMFSLCIRGKIEKTRHFIPCGSHTFEVDVFHDKNEGLVIAEIELQSEDEKFEKPGWLGEEVTGNPEYYSVNLRK